MATTLLSDLYTPTVAMEYARQSFSTSLELFNNAMGGNNPIEIVNPGDFAEGGVAIDVPVFKRIASLITRRDLTSVGAITGLKLDGTNDQGVLCSKKVGHVEYATDAEWLSKAKKGDISREVGIQAGEGAMAVIQSAVISALIGAVGAMTSSLHTSTVWATGARTNLSPSVLVGGLQLMGDFQQKIIHWLMRSESQTDLFVDAIGRSYDAVGGAALQGDRARNTIGRGFSIVDDSNLTVADGGFDKYLTLGLGKGAIRVIIARPLMFYDELQYVNTEQVTRHIRGDFDFLLQVPGFKFDASGQANPSDATLATTGNWTPNYSSHKEVGIVKIVHNYSGN